MFAGVDPKVRPPSGSVHTTFVIRFSSHVRLGLHRGVMTEYDLDAFEGNRHPPVGCLGGFGDAIRRGGRGQWIEFREGPHLPDGLYSSSWCPARYRAKIRLVETHVCRSHETQPCRPAPGKVSVVVGRISWMVRRPKT